MKVVFLDRDGVINRDPGDARYVMRVSDLRFVPRAKAGLRLLHEAGYTVFVVSNQAGVGRGWFTIEQLDAVTRKLVREVEKAGGKIRGTYYCVHAPDAGCACRKPKPGLFELIREETGINPAGAFYVGDAIRDVQAAESAGLRSILVLTGKEQLKNRSSWEAQPDFVFRNLYEAARFITENT